MLLAVYSWLTGGVETDSRPPPVPLLKSAIESARRALRRLDSDHVPAGLRDIAGRSGKLPAPLARRLLAALDASEWLRNESLAQWPGADLESEDPLEAAGALFLARPPGWESRLAEVEASFAQRVTPPPARRTPPPPTRPDAELAVLQARLAEAGERAAAAEARAKKFRRQMDRQRAAVAEHAEEVARLAAEVDSLRNQIAGLEEERRQLLRRLARPTHREAAPPPLPSPWAQRSPTDLARHLDDLKEAWSPGPAGEEYLAAAAGDRDPGDGKLLIPPGIRPDQPEAVSWLNRLPRSLTVVVDGWNAAHLLKSPPDRAARQRIVEAGRRLRRQAGGRRRVVVVFDSQEGSEVLSDPDVELRFVPSADSEVVEIARSTTPAAVISSDRSVREAAEESGAVGLWSEALVGWLESRP
jgi:hypothetical protein